MILCVVGLHGSGKGEVADILSGRGFAVLDMGDIIREEMARSGIVVTRETDRSFPVELREKRGKDIVAVLTVEKLRKLDSDDIVLTGIRSTYELDYLRSKVPSLTLVAVETPTEVRFERLRARGRPSDPKTLEEFNERDEREAKANMGSERYRKAGLNAVIAMADYRIANSGTRDELKEAVGKVLSNIKRRQLRKA